MTIYDKAWKLLEEKDWTQRAYARDENFFPVPVSDECAQYFCMVGALERVYPDNAKFKEVTTKISQYLREQYGCVNDAFLVAWNDDDMRKKEDVLRVLKECDV